jgi:hypothetical protein
MVFTTTVLVPRSRVAERSVKVMCRTLRGAKITNCLPPNDNEERDRIVNKALWLAAIFAIAVPTGCSSPSLSSTNSPAGRLMGTMDDWVNAVCNSPRFDRGTLMPSATGGGQCANLASVRGMGPVGRYEFVWGSYPSGSESAISSDLAMLGPYAEGNDGTEAVVFAVFMGENHAGLTPLERFGFVLYPGQMSACYGVNSHQRVECPPEGEPSTAPAQPPAVGPAPASTNAMPPSTAMPPAPGNATSQYVRTESGKVRCVVQPDQVACEASGPAGTGFLQAPIEISESQCKYSPCPGGIHSDLAEVTASGAFHWNDGNIGGVGSDW